MQDDETRSPDGQEEEEGPKAKGVTRRGFLGTVAVGGAAVGAGCMGVMGGPAGLGGPDASVSVPDAGADGGDGDATDGGVGDTGGGDGGGGTDGDVSPSDGDVQVLDGDTEGDADADVGEVDLSGRVLVARNGSPVENVSAVLALAGGIERLVGADDVVVLNPNGQWPRQGYTHTLCMKALIDAILDRPGGFDGEVVIAEHVHRSPSDTLSGEYCWNISAGSNRQNNWPDMSYMELVEDYHSRGAPNVSAAPLVDSGYDSEFVVADGPGELEPGQNGWVRASYTAMANGRTARLSHPVIWSPYGSRHIDLRNGVWEGGGYSGRRVRLAFLPTLNNHSSYGREDYAGVTSAVKCHLGIVEFRGSEGVNLHDVGYEDGHPEAVGEAVGHLITEILSPDFYMTCAEYTGYRGRTSSEAAHTRTIGLAADPVTLDYWMCKHVMYPADTSQEFMNPDGDNNVRRQLEGCHALGVGTLEESEMAVEIAE